MQQRKDDPHYSEGQDGSRCPSMVDGMHAWMSFTNGRSVHNELNSDQLYDFFRVELQEAVSQIGINIIVIMTKFGTESIIVLLESLLNPRKKTLVLLVFEKLAFEESSILPAPDTNYAAVQIPVPGCSWVDVHAHYSCSSLIFRLRFADNGTTCEVHAHHGEASRRTLVWRHHARGQLYLANISISIDLI